MKHNKSSLAVINIILCARAWLQAFLQKQNKIIQRLSILLLYNDRQYSSHLSSMLPDNIEHNLQLSGKLTKQFEWILMRMRGLNGKELLVTKLQY